MYNRSTQVYPSIAVYRLFDQKVPNHALPYFSMPQDKEDDAQLGIKSTALKFGERTQPLLAVIATGMVGSLASMGVAANLAWPYYLSLVPLGGHIIRQVSLLSFFIGQRTLL